MGRIFVDPITKRVTNFPDNITDKQLRLFFSNRGEAMRRPVPPEIAAERELTRTEDIEFQLREVFDVGEPRLVPLKRAPSGEVAELEVPGVRFDVARSNLLSEKISKLEAAFPGAMISPVDDPKTGGKLIAIRMQGDREAVLLNSDQFFTLSDAAEIAGGLFNVETLLSVAGTIISRGQSFLARISKVGAATGLGSAIDKSIEAVRGFEEDPLNEIFQQVTIATGLGAGGEAMFAIPRRGVRAATGRGFAELTPEERAAQAAAEEAKIPGLTLGDTNPLAKTIEQQAAGTSKEVAERRINKLREALSSIRQLRDDAGDLTGLTDEELIRVVNRIEQDIFTLVTTDARITAETAGRALQKGRQEFVRIWKDFVGRRYNRALAAGEDAGFDLTPAHNRAREIKAGVKGRGKPKKVETGLVDAQGRPLTTTKETKVQIRKLDEELSGIVDDLLKLDPNVRAFEGNTAFEQLKELRTRLFDLKNAAVKGQETIQNRLAGQLWDEVSNVMENPIGGNPAFRRLHRAAAVANRTFEKILETVDLKRIARETNIEDLVPALARPFKGSTLRLLRRIVPRDRWQRFVEGFKNDLVNDPAQINSRLGAFRRDKAALRLLMSEKDEIAYRRFGSEMERFNSSPIKKLLSEQSSRFRRALTLVETQDADALTRIIDKAGGKQSKVGRSLRAGLFEHLLNVSEKTARGRQIIRPETFNKEVAKMNRNGMIDAVLMPAEARLLRDRNGYISFLREGDITGASIQRATIGADIAQGVVIPIAPVKATKQFLNGVRAAGRNALVGRFLTSDLGRRILVGIGKRQPDLTTLRALSAVAAETAGRAEQDALKTPKESKPGGPQ